MHNVIVFGGCSVEVSFPLMSWANLAVEAGTFVSCGFWVGIGEEEICGFGVALGWVGVGVGWVFAEGARGDAAVEDDWAEPWLG